MKRFIAGLCLVSAFVFAYGLSRTVGQNDGKKPIQVAGNRPGNVPQLDLTLSRGGQLKLLRLRGKILVVDFWATWCDACIRETPELNAIYDKYKDKGVEVIGVAVQSGDLDVVIPKAKEFGMRYPITIGDDQTEKAFGEHLGFPMTYVLARDGTIHKKYLGATPFKKASMERELDSLIAESAAQ